MKLIILGLIKFYQRYLSLDQGWPSKIFPREQRVCRFHPTCSQYCYEAVNKYGIMRGGRLGVKRICRCHPWSKGGPDPVP